MRTERGQRLKGGDGIGRNIGGPNGHACLFFERTIQFSGFDGFALLEKGDTIAADLHFTQQMRVQKHGSATLRVVTG